MKYLLQALESRHSRLGLSDQELKQLLNDVQEGRETKGSDEWYDSLEKVVTELRTTPDAHWFLKPVSKKDVRDYHLVVKHPMDLGTVLKKVKTRVYKTKAEFKADLDLIWDNCLLYNSSPTHPIRHNAIQMRRKADHHLDFLVEAATTQKDPLAALDFRDEDDSEEEAAAKKLQLVNGGSKAVKVVAKREKDAKGRLKKRARADSTSSQTTARARSPPLSTRASLTRTAASMAQFQELDRELAESPFPIAGPSRIPAGPSRVPAGPSSTASKPRKPPVALKRARFSLRNVKQTPWDGSEPAPTTGGNQPPAAVDASNLPVTSAGGDAEEDLDGRWWKYAQGEEVLRAGVPDIPQMAQDFQRRRRKGIGLSKGKGKASEPSLKPQPPPPPTIPSSTDPPQQPSASPLPPTSLPHPSLSTQVYHNIASLHKVQRLHAKLIALDGDPSTSPTKRTTELPASAAAAPEESEEEVPDDAREARRLARERQRRLPTAGRLARRRPEVSSAQAAEGLKLFAGTMLAHAGFEGSQQAALDTITDVTATFLSNLGRTLRYYADAQAHKMTAEEMVLHTLYQNGTREVAQLERYVHEDVERHGAKLSELAKRMQQAYTETVESTVIEDDMLFADDGEMFMSNFAEDLGEDFFGFKELGLDKELGLSTFSVPSRLFHGQPNKGLPGPARARPEPVLEHPPPPDFVRLALSDVPLQIGLLRPFYEAEFRKLLPSPAAAPSAAELSAPPSGALPTPSSSAARGETSLEDTTNPPAQPTPTALLPTPLPTATPAPSAGPLPTLTSLSPSTTLSDDVFDPALLKKLGTLSQIPAAASASATAAAKRKKEAALEARARRGEALQPPKKKNKKNAGIGRGNWARPKKDPNAPAKPKRTPSKATTVATSTNESPLKPSSAAATTANGTPAPASLLNGVNPGANGAAADAAGFKLEGAEGIRVG